LEYTKAVLDADLEYTKAVLDADVHYNKAENRCQFLASRTDVLLHILRR